MTCAEGRGFTWVLCFNIYSAVECQEMKQLETKNPQKLDYASCFLAAVKVV